MLNSRMSQKFDIAKAYWNPHHGVCEVFNDQHFQAHGLVRFGVLDSNYRSTFNMRIMMLDDFARQMILIKGRNKRNVYNSTFEFDSEALEFINLLELDCEFLKSVNALVADKSTIDPNPVWKQHSDTKKLADGRNLSEAAAMSPKFEIAKAYWNPHHGLCEMFNDRHFQARGLVRFGVLDSNYKNAFNMRIIMLDDFARQMTLINGKNKKNFHTCSYDFDYASLEHISRLKLESAFLKSINAMEVDKSTPDPNPLWKQHSDTKKLADGGNLSEAAAKCMTTAAIIKAKMN